MGWWSDLKGWAGEEFNPTNPANNPYANVDQNNFNMPGFKGRDQFTQSQAEAAQGRQAFQAADSPFRAQQAQQMDRYNRMFNNDSESLALQQAQQAQQAAAAQQRSLMASASPNNAAMMARVGSQNIGRQNAAIEGQGMMARNAERMGLAGALTNLSTNARGQDQQNNQFNAGMQQGNRNANDAYAQGMTGLNMQNAGMQQSGMMNYEQNRLGRFNTIAGQPTDAERVVGGITGAVQTLGPLIAMSDKRTKANVKGGGNEADSFMSSIDDVTFNYETQNAQKRGPSQPMAFEYGRDVSPRGGRVNAAPPSAPAPNPYKRTYRGKDGKTYEVTLGQAQIEEGPPASLQPTEGPQAPMVQPEPNVTGGRNLGVMAQDVQKTPMGAQAVKSQGGILGIDPTVITGPVLASLARLNERLSKVESPRNYDRVTSIRDSKGDIQGRERAPIRGSK